MIQIENLHKSYGEFQALQNINLHIERGSIFGLIGPNGAGKTTLIKTIMGILLPSGGRVLIDGRDVHRDPAVKSRVGYVADYQHYYPGFRVKDMIRLYRRTYPHWSEERFTELSRVFHLPEGQKVAKLSKGMRTQLAVLLNLSLMPAVLVLDEPTSGLDPVLRRQVLNILMDEVAGNGTTILIATHQLNELERTCDHIGILHEGRVLFDESLEQMKKNIRRIQAAFNVDFPEEFLKRPEILKVERQGRVYSIVVKENIDGIKAELLNYQPLLLEDIDLSLEDIFIYRMGGLGYEFHGVVA
ncbi:MAG: ABC transporter ATP-binding protein [Thermoanaerobacterales bacterium]|nr:ABC transporter ATP-binding protein [Thermoanaerobacterales bacterium]